MVTARDDELGAGHPATEAIADLSRDGMVERIALAGLPEADVDAIIEADSGRVPTPEFAHELHAET